MERAAATPGRSFRDSFREPFDESRPSSMASPKRSVALRTSNSFSLLGFDRLAKRC